MVIVCARRPARHFGDCALTLNLTSPTGALAAIAASFAGTNRCRIQAREDGAFADDRFLDLGEVILPGLGYDELAIQRALRHGEYEWSVPEPAATLSGLHEAIGGNPPNDKERDKIRRLLDSFGGIAIRLGLTHPVFDPLALAAMPFRRPTTVVSDTSGVLQGGLSFVARNLHPAARLKIPAVVQMEIVNSSDRFFSNRRSGTRVRKHDLLIDHANSQAAQRVLLQLELRSPVELERTFLLGDPLRAAFKNDEERELKELNLSVPIRSYADRLILEAARQHQALVSPGHQVLLLTSDHGLARMAISEGLMPLYFRSAKAEALFGRTHTGCNLKPFDGQLVETALAEVLWELATTFGTARLASAEGAPRITVHAIGQTLAWAPYHSHDDLLWVETHDRTPTPRSESYPARGSSPASEDASEKRYPGLRHTIRQSLNSADVVIRTSEPTLDSGELGDDGRTPLHKMSVSSLFKLVEELDREQALSEPQVAGIIDSKSPRGLSEYRRFLSSGGALEVIDDTWRAKAGLRPIFAALANADAERLAEALDPMPAFAALRRALHEAPRGISFPTKEAFKRAEATYTTLAEITLLGAAVHNVGFFATNTRPSDEEFVPLAIAAYQSLSAEGGWASTGQWLEALVSTHGIHPLVARTRLQSAADRGLMQRFFEGSTTDTKLDRHAIRVLAVRNGISYLKTEYLYRGDFLMPGRGGSSLRIMEAHDEPA